ncbi:MAG TPA: tetratricopeptide repeat protein [Blastocatellia bacterium]|nr:tetratricopeptide repeat protein [Blastocatellia bacterium]
MLKRTLLPLSFIVIAIVCQFIPLLNVLGYEYSALMGMLTAICAGAVGVLRANKAKVAGQSIAKQFFITAGFGFALLVTALLISVTTTYSIHQCHIKEGIKLFAFIALPALIHFAGLGVLLGVLFKRRRVALAVLVSYVIATALHSAYQFWWGQQVPSNVIVGFANASGYAGFSDRLFWHPSFIYFRSLVSVAGILFIAIATIKSEPAKNRLLRPSLAMIAVGALVIIGFALHSADKWGIGSGRSRIASTLTAVYETDHVVIHYPPNTQVASHIAQIAEDHEWLFHQLSGILQHTPAWKVQSYIYADQQQMEQSTGADGYIFTQPWHHEIHIPYDGSVNGVEYATLKHEMVHLLMGDYGDRFLCVNLNRGILEGTAVAIADDLFRGPAFQISAAAAKDSGHLTSATVLFSESGFGFGSASISKSYNLAGSFIGFLIDRYGIDKLRTLYKTSDFKGTYGSDLSQLDGQWQTYLAGIQPDEREIKRISYLYDDSVFRPLYKDNCPRIGSREPSPYEIAESLERQKRYSEAIAKYQQLYNDENHNPEWLVRIAEVYKEESDYKQAISTLEMAADAPRLPHVILEDAVTSLFDLLIRQKRWEDASRVLADAERRDVGSPEWRELRRRILQEDPDVRELIFDGLTDARNEQASWDFRKAIERDPSFGLSYLFLADRVNRHEKDSLTYFGLSEKFLLLTPGLDRLKARVLLRLGDYKYTRRDWESAKGYFKQAFDVAPDVQQKQAANDWLARLDWRVNWTAHKSETNHSNKSGVDFSFSPRKL